MSFELLWRFVARLDILCKYRYTFIIVLTHAFVMFWYPTYGNLWIMNVHYRTKVIWMFTEGYNFHKEIKVKIEKNIKDWGCHYEASNKVILVLRKVAWANSWAITIIKTQGSAHTTLCSNCSFKGQGPRDMKLWNEIIHIFTIDRNNLIISTLFFQIRWTSLMMRLIYHAQPARPEAMPSTALTDAVH